MFALRCTEILELFIKKKKKKAGPGWGGTVDWALVWEPKKMLYVSSKSISIHRCPFHCFFSLSIFHYKIWCYLFKVLRYTKNNITSCLSACHVYIYLHIHTSVSLYLHIYICVYNSYKGRRAVLVWSMGSGIRLPGSKPVICVTWSAQVSSASHSNLIFLSVK